MTSREGEQPPASQSGNDQERKSEGKKRTALPERYARLELEKLSREELLQTRQELQQSGDWRKGGGKRLLDRIDGRLSQMGEAKAVEEPTQPATQETTEVASTETAEETVDTGEEEEATRAWLESENPQFRPIPQKQRFQKEPPEVPAASTETELPPVPKETPAPLSAPESPVKEVKKKETEEKPTVPETFTMPAGPEPTPEVQTVIPQPAETTPPVPEAEPIRLDAETEDLLHVLERTESSASFVNRLRHNKEYARIHTAIEELQKGDTHSKENDALFDSLERLNRKRIEKNDELVAGDAAAVLLRHAIGRGKISPNPDDSSRYLHAISRSRGEEEALTLFHQLRERTHGMQQERTGATGTEAVDFATLVGETWFEKLKADVAKTEQRDRHVHIPPEVLGRLQRVIESEPLPETLDDRVRAAAEYIGILRGWRSVETAPEAQESEPTPTILSASRLSYAKALQSQSRVFGRSSSVALEQARTEYQSAIEREVAEKIQAITASLERTPTGEPITPEAEAAVQAAIVEAVLTNRFEEEAALRESMRESSEKTAASRFKEYWRRHPKARLAISLALTGATVGSAASGFVLAAGILQSVRSGLAGISTTMSTEAIWEQSRDTWGETKKMTSEGVAKLSDADLERRLAAHTVASAGFEKGFYERKRGRAETIAMLQEEYRRRKTEAMEKDMEAMKLAGRSANEMAEALLLNSMNDELALHRSYEERKAVDRKNTIKKWTVATTTGVVVATLTGVVGSRHIARAAESVLAKETGEHAVSHGSAVAEHGLSADSLHATTEQATTGVHLPAAEQLAPAEHLPAAAGAEHAATAAQEAAASQTGELYKGQLGDAIIHKGEGIEHALRRQIEAMPEKFGFHGDTSDTAAIHEWSGGEAHRIAIHEGLVKPDGSETRVLFDADHPAQFVLNGEGHVQSVDAHTYAAAPEHGGGVPTEHSFNESPLGRDLHIRPAPHPEFTTDAPAPEGSIPTAESSNAVAQQPGVHDAVEAHNQAAIQEINEKFGDTPIELSKKGQEALSAFREMGHTLDTTDTETYSALKKAVYAQPARDALNRKLMEAFIDKQAGGSHETAKTYAKVLEKLFKTIPKNTLRRDETIGNVMTRMASALDANKASVIA